MDFQLSFCIILVALCQMSVADADNALASITQRRSFAFDNSTYEVSDTKLDWFLANYACKLKGMKLVSIETKEEDKFLHDLMVTNFPSEHYWTSGNDIYREGRFYWDSTGEVFGPYSNWWQGHPGGGSAQNCLVMNAAADLKWNDYQCSGAFLFICEVRDDLCTPLN